MCMSNRKVTYIICLEFLKIISYLTMCRYYRECLEMHILRKIDFPEDKYMTVFMGYGTEDNHLVVELTCCKIPHILQPYILG